MDTENLGTFVEQFFRRSELQSNYPKAKRFNRTIIIPNIRKNVNAVITLFKNGVSEHFTGFSCKIVHKEKGVITDHWFGFRDYLPKPIDKRIDFYHIVLTDWYCSCPEREDVLVMISKMIEYIKLWA